MFEEPVKIGGQVDIQEALGRNIICDDGIPRVVVNITMSLRHPDKCIINETDTDDESGHFVHTLSLVCQIMGKSLPDKDTQAAASRLWGSYKYTDHKHPRERLAAKWLATKSGLVVPN